MNNQASEPPIDIKKVEKPYDIIKKQEIHNIVNFRSKQKYIVKKFRPRDYQRMETINLLYKIILGLIIFGALIITIIKMVKQILIDMKKENLEYETFHNDTIDYCWKQYIALKCNSSTNKNPSSKCKKYFECYQKENKEPPFAFFRFLHQINIEFFLQISTRTSIILGVILASLIFFFFKNLFQDGI